ncbi:SPOR domain-containing protein [Sphingomonas sp. I4]
MSCPKPAPRPIATARRARRRPRRPNPPLPASPRPRPPPSARPPPRSSPPKEGRRREKGRGREEGAGRQGSCRGKKLARANPARIWVQVAGGANEDDLPKAWNAAKSKAPEMFAAHKGYKMPLRNTHRVLTGPFKTDAEARAFVNQLAKKGVSAFPVSSEAGQSVVRLDAK